MLFLIKKRARTEFKQGPLSENCLNSFVQFFPQHEMVGLLNSALEHDSSSLLDFLFRAPLGETAVVVVIVVGPLIFFFTVF